MNVSHDRESHTRSLIKAVTWRTIGTIDTILLSWWLTGRFVLAVSIGAAELVTKTVLYYLHERAWQLLPRGTVRRWLRRLLPGRGQASLSLRSERNDMEAESASEILTAAQGGLS